MALDRRTGQSLDGAVLVVPFLNRECYRVESGPSPALGYAITLACAAVVGTMGVALATNHLENGFFIFRLGEGYK